MLSLLLQTQILDKDKNIIKQKAFIAQSFVSNFLACLMRNMKQNSVTMIDTSTTERTVSVTDNFLSTIIAGGTTELSANQQSTGDSADNIGLLVGTSVSATTWNQSSMVSKIAHGTGSGELEYFGGFIGDVVLSGADAYFDIERIFRNNSGGSIDVKEFGLVGLISTYGYLYVRDAFTDSGDWATVADGEYLKVTYRLKITV